MMSEIERIGEHARDPAEYVCYMVQGSSREPRGRRKYIPETVERVPAIEQTAVL